MPARHISHNAALKAKIAQLSLPLQPLVQITSAQKHALFPATLLHFWLLTSAQLDELARFYHQREASEWSAHYPCPVVWAGDLSLEGKRRKFGRFIGLRGCDSPVGPLLPSADSGDGEGDGDEDEDEIWEGARRAREEADARLRKAGW